MVEIKKALEVNKSDEYLAEIFVEGFYKWLKVFSKDKAKLKNAFKHMFQLEYFYLAIKDNIPVGMTAVGDGNNYIVKLSKKDLTRNLGAIMGRIAYHFLRKEFEVLGKHGMERKPEIAFVSVLESYRRQGIAEEMLSFVINNTMHQEYILEVASNNIGAIKLYERLGFEEFLRVPVKNKKQAGFDNYLYLIKRK